TNTNGYMYIKKILPTILPSPVSAFGPNVDFIINSNSNGTVREVLKKYMIIACVSLIEEFLSRLGRRTIEDKKIDISVFGSEISKGFCKCEPNLTCWQGPTCGLAQTVN